MFNEKYHHPLVPFSWQHLVALAVVVSIILIVFFCRKFFMKNKIADRVFRYSLVFLLLFFELIPYFKNGLRSLFGVIIEPYPLCGHLLWVSVIVLLSNSERVQKLFYPLMLTGATMSLLVLDMDCTFPHFRAFQFFFTHGCFMLGALYFVFTQKISKYTLKDLRNSCFVLLGFSLITIILANAIRRGEPTYSDPYFVLTPPGDLMFFKDALGQFGYTVVYILLIFIVQFTIYGITYLCTKNRKPENKLLPEFKNNKVLNYLSNVSNNKKYMFLFLLFSAGTYFTVLAKITSSPFLIVLNILTFFILLLSLALNEVVHNYKVYYLAKNNASTKTETTEAMVTETNNVETQVQENVETKLQENNTEKNNN